MPRTASRQETPQISFTRQLGRGTAKRSKALTRVKRDTRSAEMGMAPRVP